MHRFQLVFLNVSIAPIWLILFTTLNIIRLRRSIRDAVDLNCCLEWAVNESDFIRFLEDVRDRRNDCPLFYLFIAECYLYNIVTHRDFT